MLAAQCLCSVLVALVIALASGLPVIRFDDGPQLLSTLAVVPLMAILGVAGATVVRRPLWLPAGFAGWLIFVEGLLYRLEGPLPFSLFLNAAATGDSRAWLTLAAWAGGALLAAGVAITRDMTGD